MLELLLLPVRQLGQLTQLLLALAAVSAGARQGTGKRGGANGQDDGRRDRRAQETENDCAQERVDAELYPADAAAHKCLIDTGAAVVTPSWSRATGRQERLSRNEGSTSAADN